ncbi:MAG: hypothetical protein RAP03_10075, partial [Candidatus Electryonea clarkiae]|nr:hypothetical protein [Candidatus Electryonea clarkiae]
NGITKLTATDPLFFCFKVGVDNVTIIFDDPLSRSFLSLDLLHLTLSEKVKVNKQRPLAERPESFRAEKIFIKADDRVHAIRLVK